MRKLLLILLLLFPVHGAWGKMVLNCIYDGDIEMTYIIYEKKNKITNLQGLDYINIYIHKNSFKFDGPIQGKEFTIYINRITGNTTSTAMIGDRKSELKGFCKKITERKF